MEVGDPSSGAMSEARRGLCRQWLSLTTERGILAPSL